MAQYTDQAIALLSTVALREELPERDLEKGTVGTVVELLGDEVYEVEFCDDDGETVDQCSISGHLLTVLPRESQL
ncbi:MAG: DUF4926 domain-containing protein [Pyrinomonadaceae bacterium]